MLLIDILSESLYFDKNSSLYYYGIYILLRGGFSFKTVISIVKESEGSFHMQVILYLFLANNRSQILTRCRLYEEPMPVTVQIEWDFIVNEFT